MRGQYQLVNKCGEAADVPEVFRAETEVVSEFPTHYLVH